MNHKEILLKINQRLLTDSPNLPSRILKELIDLKKVIENQKSMVTVLITLGIHKIFNPQQDIRNHMAQIPGGFGGRRIDTDFISPTLGELGYPYCKESGWLSRSLEQPHPFDQNFPGNIKTGKNAFLNLVHTIQTEPEYAEDIILTVLSYLNEIKQRNTITLVPLKNPDSISINDLCYKLKILVEKKYAKSGGSKLPVIILYCCLKIFCDEVKKYKGCHIKSLGSHLSPDFRSKSSGDIEIFEHDNLIESYEIKLNKEITFNLINNNIREKIYLHNPKRYFVLSSKLKESDSQKINKIIKEIKNEHGCEIIVDDPIKLVQRYLILLTNSKKFIELLSDMILIDHELKIEHKEEWRKLHQELNSSK
jgi:DNA (cytosine-5)-methyltransferase 1